MLLPSRRTSIAVTLGVAAWGAAAGGVAKTAEVLTLAAAEQSALRHQPTIREAYGEADAAAGRVEQARSGYLPQLNLSGIYQRTTGNFAVRPGALPQTANGVTTTPSPTSWNPSFNFWNFGLQASQLIYDFNATANRWRSAAVGRDAALATARAQETQALLAVRQAYFQARAQVDLVRVAQESVVNQQKHVDQIRALVQVGLRSEIDLATTLTGLANARVQLVTTANAEAAARAVLTQAMGVPASDGQYELADTQLPPVPGEDGDAAKLVDAALRARAEVTAADKQSRAQELLVSATRGEYGPALSLTGGATEVGAALDRLTPNWFVGLSATWALFQGGLTHGEVHEARGTLASLVATADGVRLQVRVEVEQARLAVRAGKATIAGAEEALVNAREQLRLAEGRYETGLGSVIELYDAQVAYTTAEAQLVSARFNLAVARAQLLGALGQR